MARMLSTVDNPYDPRTSWDEWFAYDTTHGYHTCGLVARLCTSTDSLTENLEVQKPSRQRTEAPQASAFGDWDLRRENIVRSTETNTAPAVERYEDTSSDDDELETPPFFKNR